MATEESFAWFVCDQIQGAGEIRCKKMFGEYMIYVDEKPTFLVCDNSVYVKKLPCVEQLLADAKSGAPYSGAKEHYILDIEQAELAKEVAGLVSLNTPFPKKKK